jgi:hypothetical protein
VFGMWLITLTNSSLLSLHFWLSSWLSWSGYLDQAD